MCSFLPEAERSLCFTPGGPDRKPPCERQEGNLQPAKGSGARGLGVQVEVFLSLYQFQNLSNRIVTFILEKENAKIS